MPLIGPADNVTFRQYDSRADFPPAASMEAGALAWAVNDSGQDQAGMYVVRWQDPATLIWDYVAGSGGSLSQPYIETRRTWETLAQPIVVNNAPTATMKSRYPILPLTDFSSDPAVCNPVLELDVTGFGPFVELTYGVDFGLLPRTPQLVGAPGIGFGFGLQSQPPPSGPRATMANQAVGFAVSAAVAAALVGASRFRFSWTERTLLIEPRGAAAGIVETVAPFGDQPSFTDRYSVGAGVGPNFPNSPVQFSPGQFGIWFPPQRDMQIELWRRMSRTRAGAYRDNGNQQKGLRRFSTSFVPFDRLPVGTWFAQPNTNFYGHQSKEIQFAWCYWSDALQARSRISSETIFRSGYNPLRTSIGGAQVFRSGFSMWIGLR